MVKTNKKSTKTKHAVRPKSRRVLGLKLHHASGLALLLIGVVWGGLFVAGRVGNSAAQDGCSISDKLVNSCRPWLGATARNYPQAADDTKSQLLYHEQRIGRQLDIVHTYHPIGNNSLSTTDKYFANRAGTYLFANWKPAAKWADAGGNNTSVNSGIDTMAASVKSLGSKKIFMTLHHEAENDVSSGGTCASYKGSAGSADQYKAMWRNVQQRFKQAGVSNVVWVMDYMNYSPWDCVVNQLYPGDDLVDWIMFNGYGVADKTTWKDKINHFYNFLTSNSNSQHNYLSKPWGVVEWSITDATVDQQASYFDQVKTALEQNTFPNLKAYMVFDERDGGSETGANYRIAYDKSGVYSGTLQARYNAFANSPFITGSGASSSPPSPPPQPAKDTIPPTVTLTSPADGATISKTITITGLASDNASVKAVTLRVDDQYVTKDEASPYSLTLDTKNYKDGKHTIVLRAWDPTNNMAQSKTITVTIQNGSQGSGGGTGSTQPPPSRTTTISPAASETTAAPVPINGLVIVEPSVAGNSIQLWIDNKLAATNTFDASNLTNGTHTVKIVENGQVTFKQVSVKNPLPLAALNQARANAFTYIVGSVAVLVLAFSWLGRGYVVGFSSRRERAITKKQRRVPPFGKHL